MRVTRSKRWVSRHHIRFQGLKETAAEPPRRTVARRHGSSALTPLVFDCPRTRSSRASDHCLRCEYFVSLRPVPHRRLVTLSCSCSDADPIVCSAEVRRSWPTVDPGAPMREARRLVTVHDVPLVLVARDDVVLGVVYRNQAVGSEDPVAAGMTQYPWSVSTRATLGDAVEALRVSNVPALLVLGPEAELVAVVSARHLAQLGVPTQLLKR